MVERNGVVRGRAHDLESLYDPILEATGADDETRATLLGDRPASLPKIQEGTPRPSAESP